MMLHFMKCDIIISHVFRHAHVVVAGVAAKAFETRTNPRAVHVAIMQVALPADLQPPQVAGAQVLHEATVGEIFGITPKLTTHVSPSRRRRIAFGYSFQKSLSAIKTWPSRVGA